MSLGHLNEFGQYISELDIEHVPDLDKKKGNSRFNCLTLSHLSL